MSRVIGVFATALVALALLAPMALADPTTGQPYSSNHSIYDAWVTQSSGGVDFEALGVIHYYGKTLTSDWDNVGDADTRAFIDADTTLSGPVTVGVGMGISLTVTPELIFQIPVFIGQYREKIEYHQVR